MLPDKSKNSKFTKKDYSNETDNENIILIALVSIILIFGIGILGSG